MGYGLLMRAKSSLSEQRTFTESARRTQIVAAAIEVIAEQGYASASFARIAKQAGLSSTGMISYHFNGKGDLINEVVAEVLRVISEFMVVRVDAATSFRGRLRAFILSRFELLEEYPKHMRALLAIADAVRLDDPQISGLVPVLDHTMEVQAERLRLGQELGEFRVFEPRAMVLAISGAIDAAVARAVSEPGFDIAACAQEYAELFDLATRSAS